MLVSGGLCGLKKVQRLCDLFVDLGEPSDALLGLACMCIRHRIELFTLPLSIIVMIPIDSITQSPCN